MVARADILAGRAVILVDIQDQTERGLRAIRSQVRLTALAIKDIGGDLFRGGIFGTLASALPVKSFMDFQDQMLFLQTKSQATEAQMTSLEKVIRRLGMTTSYSSTEVAEAATMLAQASFKPEAIEATLEAVLDLGRGAKISLEESASLLANTIETFKLGAGSAANVASKFIAASRLGTLDVIDLKESMKELSGTFFNLGISLDETLALITALSFSSLKATKAGTSLNTEFLNMVSNADKMKEFFNIDVTDGAGNFRGIVPILTEMEVALTKLGNAERTAKVAEIFNIRGGRAESAIFIRSMKEVVNTLNQISGAGDEARISAIKLDSALGGVFRRGVSAFEELMIAVGSTSEGPLSKFGENLAAVFNDLSRLSLKNQQLTQNLLLIGPAALVAGAGLLGMTMILGKVAMLLTPLMMLNRVIFDIAANIVGLNLKLAKGIGSGVQGGILSLIGKPDTKFASNFASHQERVRKLGEQGAKTAAKQNITLTSIIQRNQKKVIELGERHAKARADLRKKNNQATLKDQSDLNNRLVSLQNKQAIERAALLKRQQELLVRAQSAIPAERVVGQLGVTTGQKAQLAAIKFNEGVKKQQEALLEMRAKFQQEEAALEKRFTKQRQAIKGLSGPASEMALLEKQNKQRKTLLSKAALEEASLAKKARLSTLSANKKLAKELAGAPKDASSFLTKSRGPSIFAGLVSVLKDVRKAFSFNFKSMFKGFDLINLMYKGLTGVLKITKGIFTVLNGIRRVVFSFSGILTIVELLIIFGDKLPGINTVLNSLSAGFGNLFSGIGETLRNLGPSLGNAWDSIKMMFSGNIEGGIQGFKNSLIDAKNVITTGLTVAWKGFMLEVGPGIELMKQVGSSLLSGFQLAIDTISAFFGNLKDGVTILFKGDGTLFEEIKRSFGPEGVSQFFAIAGTIFAEVAKGFMTITSKIMEVLTLAKNGLIAILSLIASLPGGEGAQAALDAADPERAKLVRDLAEIMRERQRDLRVFQEGGLTSDELLHFEKIRIAQEKELKASLEALGPEMGTFASNLATRTTEIDGALNRFLDSLQEAADRNAHLGPSQIDQTNADRAAGKIPTTLENLVNALPKLDPSNLSNDTSEFDRPSLIPDSVRQGMLENDLKILNKIAGPRVKPADIPEVAIAAASLPKIGKAIVGGFGATRGKLQSIKSDKIAEKTLEAAERTADAVEEIKERELTFG